MEVADKKIEESNEVFIPEETRLLTNLVIWKSDHKNFVSKCVKNGLLFFCYLFWIVGGLFAAMGGWSISQKVRYGDISDLATDPGAVFAALGCLIFIVSTFGVLGSKRENLCYLKLYKVCLITILVFELCAGLVGFAFWPEIKKVIDHKMSLGIQRYNYEPRWKDMIDLVQRKFECCGSLAVDDWDSNPYYNCHRPGSYRSCGVPWSCCLDPNTRNRQCGLNVRRFRAIRKMENFVHTIGCLDKLFEFMRWHMFLIGGTAIGCNLPLLLGIFLSHKLILQITRLKAKYLDFKTHNTTSSVDTARSSTGPPFAQDIGASTLDDNDDSTLSTR